MRISVIVPIYNGAKYVPSLVRSLKDKNRNLENEMEILLVDDGSTDNSYQILLELEQKMDGIRAFTKPNGGIASARNFALQYAKGDFITFCDQDDSILKGYSNFIEKLEKNHADLLIASFGILNNNKIDFSTRKFNDVIETYRKHELLGNFVAGPILCDSITFNKYNLQDLPPNIWNCIFRREVIEKFHIQVIKYIDYEDDWLFLLKNIACASRIIIDQDYFYCWTINAQSESHRHKHVQNYLEGRKKVWAEVFSILKKDGFSSEGLTSLVKMVDMQTLIWGFFNACALTLSEYLKEVSSLVKGLSPLNRLVGIHVGKTGYLFYIVLRLHFYRLAYFINHFLLKCYYH